MLFLFSIQELTNLGTAAQETGQMEEMKWTQTQKNMVYFMSEE